MVVAVDCFAPESNVRVTVVCFVAVHCLAPEQQRRAKGMPRDPCGPGSCRGRRQKHSSARRTRKRKGRLQWERKRCPMRKVCFFFWGRSRQFVCMFVQAVCCCCCGCCCCCSWNFLAGTFLDFFVFALSRSPYRTIGGRAAVSAGCLLCLLHQLAGRRLLRRLRPQERQVHQCQAMEPHVSSKPLVECLVATGSCRSVSSFPVRYHCRTRTMRATLSSSCLHFEHDEAGMESKARRAQKQEKQRKQVPKCQNEQKSKPEKPK